MFGAKPGTTAPAGGLTVNTPAANSLFGGQQSSTTSGGLFGNKPATTTQTQTSGLFGTAGATNQTQAQQPNSGGLFGGLGSSTTNNAAAPTQPAASGGLFGNLGGNNTQQQQSQQQQPQMSGAFACGTNSTMFRPEPSKPQTPSLLGGFAAPINNQQPGSSLFGGKVNSNPNPQQQAQNSTNVIQGVKVDISQLHSTTKYEACEPILKNQISEIDAMILKQITLCNEVSDLLPAIAEQGATIPNDVDFVKQKLDTLQHGLENDACEIDQVRRFIEKDAAEARLAFRAIDALQVPLQWQVSGGYGNSSWRSPTAPASRGPGHSSTIIAEATSDNDGGPANLVDYFSGKTGEMSAVLDKFKDNMSEVEEHLGFVENLLAGQINDFMASRNRGGSSDGYNANGGRQRDLAGLTAALGEVERSILMVAGRVGGAREDVQGAILRQGGS